VAPYFSKKARRKAIKIRENPIKFILFVLIFLALTGYAETGENINIETYLSSKPEEEWARYYFSEAIQNWGETEYVKARNDIEFAFERPLYPMDIPKLWYFLAKLNIETGNTQDAMESLKNVLLIEPDKTEILILLKVLKMLGKVDAEENPILGLEYIHQIEGYQNSYEYFYNPVASDVYNEALYILDRANNFIFVTRNGKNFAINLDLEAPSSIVIDKTAGRLYCSDLVSGKIVVFDLSTNKKIDEFEGFKKPFVQTVDRLGNIYVLDPPNNRLALVSSSGKIVKYIYLSEGYMPNIVNDVDTSFDKMILQDLSSKAFRIIRMESFEEEAEFKFRDNALPIQSCAGPDGSILTVWDDNKLTSFFPGISSEYEFIDNTNIDFTVVSDLDYNAPILSITDFDKHRVREYIVVQEKPMAFTSVDSIEATTDDLIIQFRNLDSMGKNFQVISPFLNVIDSGGYVPFTLETENSTVNYIEITDGKVFFEGGFENLKKTEYNMVVWKYDGYDFNFENIAPAMFSKNVRIYIISNVTVPEKVRSLAKITGGLVISSGIETFLKEYFLSIKTILRPRVTYRLNLPFEGIKTVTISSRIAGLDYSDSIYYAIYMIPYFEKEMEYLANE
jgi:tetratricopeptide (TPR) repeat protein